MLYHLLIVTQEESFGLASVGGVSLSLQAKPAHKTTDSVQKRTFSPCHFPLVAIY